MKPSLFSIVLLFTSVAVGTRAEGQEPAAMIQAGPSASHFGAERPAARITPNISREHVWVIPATPGKIFPLLCPTLEYDWIPTWRAKMIHSKSGVAEENCIFETRSPLSGSTTWMCTRYEPPVRIDYTCFAERGFIVRLIITLEPVPEGTRMTWTRSWHATQPAGEEYVTHLDPKVHDASMKRLKSELEHYLRTGTMLKPRGN